MQAEEEEEAKARLVALLHELRLVHGVRFRRQYTVRDTIEALRRVVKLGCVRLCMQRFHS